MKDIGFVGSASYGLNAFVSVINNPYSTLHRKYKPKYVSCKHPINREGTRP